MKRTEWNNFVSEHKGLNLTIQQLSQMYRNKELEKGYDLVKPFKSHCKKLPNDQCNYPCNIVKGYYRKNGTHIEPYCRGDHMGLSNMYKSNPTMYPLNNQVNFDYYTSPNYNSSRKKKSDDVRHLPESDPNRYKESDNNSFSLSEDEETIPKIEDTIPNKPSNLTVNQLQRKYPKQIKRIINEIKADQCGVIRNQLECDNKDNCKWDIRKTQCVTLPQKRQNKR